MLLVCSKFDTDTRHKHKHIIHSQIPMQMIVQSVVCVQHNIPQRHTDTTQHHHRRLITRAQHSKTRLFQCSRARALVYLSMCLLCVHCERSNVRSARRSTDTECGNVNERERHRVRPARLLLIRWTNKANAMYYKLRNNKSFHIDDALCECARLVCVGDGTTN